MLSVRPSRCHSDTVCFSQVLLGNHSSPKPACLGASHRTELLFSFSFPAASLSVSFPFSSVCSRRHPLFEHSQRARAVIVDPILHFEVEKRINQEKKKRENHFVLFIYLIIYLKSWSLSALQVHTRTHTHTHGMPKS